MTEDQKLLQLSEERQNDPTIHISLEELRVIIEQNSQISVIQPEKQFNDIK